MSEENQKEIIEIEEAETSSDEQPKSNRKPIFIALGLIAVILIGAIGYWFFRNREGGQPVAAPRNVSFDQGSTEQAAPTAEEQTVTLEPDQVERIGLKIETVGETLSSEAVTFNFAAVPFCVERRNIFVVVPPRRFKVAMVVVAPAGKATVVLATAEKTLVTVVVVANVVVPCVFRTSRL